MSIVDRAVDKLRRSDLSVPTPEKAHVNARVQDSQPALNTTVGIVKARQPLESQPIITLHLDKLAESGLYPPKEMAPRFIDEFRRIKRPVLANITGKHASKVDRGNFIMVASSIKGEGKTFNSFNLALSFALEKDFTVVLVDGDVAKRDLSRQLGIEKRQGLLDLLSDESLSIQNAILQTNVKGLAVLPAGQPDSLSSELLASKRMEKVLGEISKKRPNCIVIFDSPPLLATSEAQVLSEMMGQILLVVAAESTPQHAVLSALELLDADKCINCILNMADTEKGEDYYGGYYYGESYKSQ